MAKERVLVNEVCPRDGWQNHPVIIPTETKLKYIRRMIDCGAKAIDATSFVNPKRVPQMFDSDEVIRGIQEYAEEKQVRLFALTLNGKGVERAAALGVKNIEFVLSASEAHNMRNSNRPIRESLEDLLRLRDSAKDMYIQLGLACAFGSPFGDEIDLDQVLSIAETARKEGFSEIGLADTAGMSDPAHTKAVLDYLCANMDPSMLLVHLHNTRGMALANVYAALQSGVRHFDAALGGLGGCPFAPGARGNIATEDMVNMLEQMGYDTGYDLSLLISTAREMCAEVQAELSSCVSLAGTCC